MNLDELEVFLVVAKSKSIARSSEILDMAGSSISRKIKKLEEELKTELFHRGGKEFATTAQGELILKRTQKLLDEAQNIRNLALEKNMDGPLRILIPPAIADILSGEFLIPFMKKYPEIELRVKVNNNRQIETLYDNDFALSPNLPQDTSLIAKTICTVNRFFYASPQLLEQYGVPEKPEDLRNYPFLAQLDNVKYRNGIQLWDNGSGLRGEVEVSPKITSDYPDLLAKMVTEGLGVACLTQGAFRHQADSTYVRLFSDEIHDNGALYGIFPSRKHRPYRVKVFIEELTRHIVNLH